jgi:hypothetical protein
MGRPIKARYFGNVNNEKHKQVSGQSGIGGEGIASITNPVQLGSFIVNSTATTTPALVIPAPAIPTGVQATAQVVWEVESVTVTNGTAGHNYQTGTNATLTGLGGGVVVRIATVGSGLGEVQTIDFNSTGSNRGSFTTLSTASNTYQIVGQGVGNGDGNNQTLVKFRVKQINVTAAGSGYDAVPTISFNNSGVSGVGPGNPTAVMQTIEKYQAIEGVAYISTGSSSAVYDIIKQEGSRSYLVKTSQGIGRCKLITTSTLTAGTMNIIATDFNGSTYFVNKLTAHKAHLVQKTASGSFLVGNNVATGWTIGTATGTVVTIAHTL